MPDAQQEPKQTLGEKVNDVAENAYLKLGVRLFPAVIGLVGWLLVSMVGDIKKTIDTNRTSDDEGRKLLWDAQRTVTQAVNSLTATVQVLSQTVAANRERADTANQQISTQMDKTNNKLELLLQAPQSDRKPQ